MGTVYRTENGRIYSRIADQPEHVLVNGVPLASLEAAVRFLNFIHNEGGNIDDLFEFKQFKTVYPKPLKFSEAGKIVLAGVKFDLALMYTLQHWVLRWIQVGKRYIIKPNDERDSEYITEDDIEWCPSWLNLSDHFPKDIRVLIYSYMSKFDKDVIELSHGFKLKCPSKFSYQAAKRGYLDILKSVHVRGYFFDNSVCSGAALNGHLDVIKWAHGLGCEIDTLVCWNAASNGHLDVLKWVKDNGFPWEFCIYSSCNHDHLHILKWAHDNGCNDKLNYEMCLSAAVTGQSCDTLQWFYDLGHVVPNHLVNYAVRTHKTKVIEWCCKNKIGN